MNLFLYPCFILTIIVMKKFLLVLFTFITQQTHAQTNWSERMANAMLETHKDSITYKEEGKFARWDYEQAILLKALERVWTRTGDGKYYQFILKNMDSYVNEKGEIKTYKGEQFNIDNITGGRILLMLYRETGKEKFKLAADLLRNQLKNQPRTQEGGFGIRRFIQIKCGWMVCIWANHFTQNTAKPLTNLKILMTSLISLFG